MANIHDVGRVNKVNIVTLVIGLNMSPLYVYVQTKSEVCFYVQQSDKMYLTLQIQLQMRNEMFCER